MKKIFRLALIAIFFIPLSFSCDSTDSLDEIEIQDESATQGNDAVVRKKPGPRK